MDIYFVVTLILIIMVIFFFFVFKNITTQLGGMAKNNMLRQVTAYDEIIESKNRELKDIQEEIDFVKAELRNRDSNPKLVNNAIQSNYSIINSSKYAEQGFADKYKKIKDSFLFDTEVYLNKIIKSVDRDDNSYLIARQILDRINLDICYELSTLREEDQYSILSACFSQEENNLLKRFLEEVKKFDCVNFVDWLKDVTFHKNTQIVIRTNDQRDNFNLFNSNIVTEYDKDICEGFYIIANGYFYDFSINANEVSG